MKSKLIDLIIPGALVTGCLILIGFDIDGEVKSILTMAAAWAFRASLVKTK
ncbi:hypothetical protein ES705_32985 [subsurface metagenome]